MGSGVPRAQMTRSRGLMLSAVVVVVLLVVQAVNSVVGAIVAERGAVVAARDTYSYVGDLMAERVVAFAGSAADVVHGTAAELTRLGEVPDAATLIPTLADRLEREPAVGTVYVGTPDGAVTALARTGAGFEMLALVPTPQPGRATVTRTAYDAALAEVSTTVEAWHYDLSTRPWYDLALESESMAWTPPFISARTGEIVVSPVRAVLRDGEPLAVVGADLDVVALGALLDEIPVGEEARGFILTGEGRIIAAPESSRNHLRDLLRESGSLPSADDLGLSSVSHAAGTVEHFHDDHGVVSLHRALDPETGLDWVLYLDTATADLAPGLQRYRDATTAVALVSLAVVVVAAVFAVRVWRPMHLMRHRATPDALTGLANRYEFYRRADATLAAADADGADALVVALDLDHFKALNDDRGHHAGDAVLAAVGRALQASMRAGDVAGRLGGDEFVAVLRLGERSDPGELAGRLRDAVEVAVRREVPGADAVGSTAGYATAADLGYDVRGLVSAADHALVAGKRVAKGRTHGYTRADDARVGAAAGSLPGD